MNTHKISMIFAIIGIILMILSGKLVEKAILYKFNNEDEIVRDRNIGTAAVYFGIYLASGLIISACVMGDSLISQSKLYNLTSTLIYYVLGVNIDKFMWFYFCKKE